MSTLGQPAAECAPRHEDAVPVERVLLTIKGHVLGEFADHDMGQQTRAGQAPLDRIGLALGRGHAVLAARAGIFRIDMSQHEHLAGLVFELLGHILADPGFIAAAAADPLRGGDIMGNVLAGKMVGNGSAAVPFLLALARWHFLVIVGRG